MKGVEVQKSMSEKIKEMEKKLDDQYAAEIRAMEAEVEEAKNQAKNGSRSRRNKNKDND